MSNPILNVPLSQVMRSEIALPLQHIMHIYTVGHFVRAWRSPRNQKNIEQIFDTPEQARHNLDVITRLRAARDEGEPEDAELMERPRLQ